MWFVLITPDSFNASDEEVWECPTNWIKYNILHYPAIPSKGRINFLDFVKRRVEPQEDWIITKSYKIIKSADGSEEFCKLTF